jgi:ribulose-5-phosphate 4-epimerase/fuculose-1-phosphate aldolase
MGQMDRQKKELTDYARLAYERKLVSGTGGNISVRTGEDGMFLVTPSGVSFRALTPDKIITVDSAGNTVDSSHSYKPSKETAMHLAIYAARPRVNAIMHLHSPYCTALSLGPARLEEITVTAAKNLHTVLIGAKVPPGSPELVSHVRSAVAGMDAEANVLLLAGHGIIALGTALEEAFNTADFAEETALVAVASKRTYEHAERRSEPVLAELHTK